MQAKPLDTQDKRTSEIAAAVQAGEVDILRLWAAVERFAWQQTLRWVRAMEGRAGVEESDLLQVAFISLMDTLPTWDVNKGEFLTLYGITQADQGGYCDQRRGIRRFCPPQRCAADAGRAFDGRTHSGADVANESACGHCVGDRDDHFDSER